MKTTQKWVSYLSVLSLLAVLEVFTGNPKWEVFLGFLPFMAFARVKADERFKSNMNKAARNGFIASILGVIGLVFVISSNPSLDKMVIAL
ncbi:MAG: DUF3796 domain-containing protein [Bacteroidetes bacterium]|nr:DUF3796 domain-containing protein [Bacteroidota bacterium]